MTEQKTPILSIPYPQETDLMSDFPALAVRQMQRIESHIHEADLLGIENLSSLLDDYEQALEGLRYKKYARMNTIRVLQTGTEPDLGFQLPGTPDRLIATVRPATTSTLARSSKLFCYYNYAQIQYVVVKVKNPAKEGEAATAIPEGWFNITYCIQE